ncbi:MAG: CvpA family protein [Candidatus Cloacimonadaceae bacterium]|jgi:membrane protein required for colicin V production|nr:CvpA family protein [Candidatus Cloacimonadota bacterium]MDY0127452.1 CvpA family protein [Candidatus Cloacimonadaceae bacterium]MCB5255615.1 CvpA family protein [Candidatus Cloacimonadota bacterium]MCK9178382.1 CvpA family protein [Candidatus Cloacimonadota bacterium]MCK9242385.1 CvpA family protein [Candidatus Cloacimonadota bacterium]
MGVIDWTIIAFLLVLTYFGLRRGLAGAIVQLAGVILTFILIGHYYPLLANQLVLKYGLSKTLSILIAVVLILILVVVVTRFVIWILDRFIKVLNLGWLNRLLGAILGLLNGLILVIIFTLIMDYMPRVSQALKNPDKHRVYVGMDTLKDDVVTHFKLNNYFKYIKLPEYMQSQEESAK